MYVPVYIYMYIFQIVDVESGKPLVPGKIGQLCVKFPCLMSGYLGKEKETKDFFDKDGFGKMSDLALYDKNGYIYHQCRISEAAKYKYQPFINFLNNKIFLIP